MCALYVYYHDMTWVEQWHITKL